MEACKEVEITPRILNWTLDREVWSASRPGCFALEGDSPQYRLHKSMCGHQIRSGRFEKEKNIFVLPGIETLPFSRLARGLISTRVTNKLSHLPIIHCI
jgi:hypothetical protein